MTSPSSITPCPLLYPPFVLAPQLTLLRLFLPSSLSLPLSPLFFAAAAYITTHQPTITGRGERLGLGAHSQPDAAADLGDVYGAYRKMRSTSYHQMIVAGAGPPPQGGGGGD